MNKRTQKRKGIGKTLLPVALAVVALVTSASAGFGITREAIIDTAEVYQLLKWTCHNTFTSTSQGSFIAGNTYIGQAYLLGGNDHWSTFLHKVEVLERQPRRGAGIDCWAYVSRCWQLNKYTAHPKERSHPIPKSMLKRGDVMYTDRGYGHSVLVESAPPKGPVVIYEAVGGTIARVVRRSSPWSRFAAYRAITIMDLGLSPQDISFDPPLPDGTVTIRATVHNDGGVSTPCEVSLYLDDTSHPIGVGQVTIQHKDIAQAEVIWNTAGLPAGDYRIIAEVGHSTPTESDIRNNQVQVDYTLSIPTFVDEEQAITPIEYTLSQNYPNPFNAETTIQYDLPHPAEVHLAIYNVHGNPVRTLVDRYEGAGRHSVTWNGRNEGGAVVAGGVYFYRMEIGGESVRTRRMVLLK